PGLVHTQPAHAVGAGLVVDQRSAVVDHRGPGAVPAHPERSGSPGNRPAISAYQPADLEPGPLGQRLAGPDRRVPLSPGLHRALWVRAAPDPLRPDEHDRPAEHRQIPDPHLAAAVTHRPGPTRRATEEVRGGLDPEPPLAND